LFDKRILKSASPDDEAPDAIPIDDAEEVEEAQEVASGGEQ
jgi:hypothetical protein